jgi:crotonobetaine/carnitine-CoA ligase
VEPKGERLYNPLPLFYANSLAISNPAMILSRNAMIFPDRFHPSSWWEEVVATRATIIHYLGVIPPLLLAREPVPEERTHRIRFGVGAGIDPPQQEEFQQRFGFPLVEVWGMSEVGIATAANEAPCGSGNRSIGRPLAEVELRIVGEQDRPLGKGQPGELVLRRAGSDPRAGFFRAYFRDEAATEEAWRGGWFHTGDIVRQEEDGSYTFVDRKKHMIRRSGQNIAAAEIEACLRAHPATAQVAVVAVPDEMRQEEVLACIVPRHMPSDPQRLARDIAEFTSTRLAYFKVPAWFFFLESLPTTATQKLQKGRIFGDDSDPRRRPGMIDLREYKQALARTRTAP